MKQHDRLRQTTSSLKNLGFVLAALHFGCPKVMGQETNIHVQSNVHAFDLPNDSLERSLIKFATQAQVNIVVTKDIVDGYRSSPIIGRYEVKQALERLLAGRPFTYEFDESSNTYTIKPKIPYRLVEAAKDSTQLQEVKLITEELFVSGIKDSLHRSLDIKREERGIVDSVVAVEMRESPDSNLAEALQRLAGVAIERLDDEGSRVTVRGIGPEFNIVTLNGRILARTTGDRSFDFSNIASEMVSAVKVHKTGDPSIFSGGIGATIDLVSMRPLETPGFKLTSSIDYVKDYSSEHANPVPEMMGLYSQTFADDKLGIALGLSYEEREYGRREALVGTGWISHPGEKVYDAGLTVESRGAVPLGNQVNRPGSGEIYSVPQSLIYRFTETQRKRVNGHLVLQWQMMDDLRATVDYFRFDRDVAVQHNEISAWFYHVASENVWGDGPIASPHIYSETYDAQNIAEGQDGLDLPMAGRDSAEKNSSDAIGFNLEWEPTEYWHFKLDLASSKANQQPDSPYGSNNSFTVSSFTRTSSSADFTGDFPALIIGGGNNLQASNMRVAGSFFESEQNKSSIDQAQIDGTFNFRDEAIINFGVEYTDVMNTSSAVAVRRNDWGGVYIDEDGDFGDEFFTERTILDRFDAETGDFSEQLANGNTLNDGTVLNRENIQDRYFDFDFEGLRRRAELLYRDNPGFNNGVLGDCGSYFCATTDYSQGDERTVEESTLSAYFNIGLESSLRNVPVALDIGMRYEKTQVHAEGLTDIYDASAWNFPATLYLNRVPESRLAVKDAEYSHLLPSFNLAFNSSENTKVRLSMSKTIGRANFFRLRSDSDIGETSINGISGVSGNTEVEPISSSNVDLGFEWYMGDINYLSLVAFRKDIRDYIVFKRQLKTSDELFGPDINLTNPAFGVLAQIATDVLETTNPVSIRNFIFENFADHESVDVDEQVIHGSADDPSLQFYIWSPQNSSQIYVVQGYEFAYQQSFGESGFGASVNYTKAYSNLKYDVIDFSPSDAPLGVGDSANLVGFYEKGPVSVRLAWNWRDKFLFSSTQGTGDHPVFIEPYKQFDLHMSYKLVDNLEVFVEGFNITEESIRIHGRSDRDLLSYVESGARWKLGVFFNF